MQKIIFLHHSTGRCIWVGDSNKYLFRITGKGSVQKFFDDHNLKNKTDYIISSQIFPKKYPYGWKNYPYDYYNIWVKHAGSQKYLDEPTLEMLAPEYNVIIFKHCFPVGRIQPDKGMPDVASEEKTMENYKLQYNALKEKMHSFPDNKFIVWTPPAMLRSQVTDEQALRTYEFYRWLIDEWDEDGDNIFMWDFYKYETDGGLYLEEKNAYGPGDSHPGKTFSEKVAPLFCRFIIDVIESKAECPVQKIKLWI